VSATAHKTRFEGVSASRRGAEPSHFTSEHTPQHHTDPSTPADPAAIDAALTDLIAGDPPAPITVRRTARTDADAGRSIGVRLACSAKNFEQSPRRHPRSRNLRVNAHRVLRGMQDASVDCVATSPPFWGLRDYGTGPWEGGRSGCEHEHCPGERSSGATCLGCPVVWVARSTGWKAMSDLR
jgi:hypothetical protein